MEIIKRSGLAIPIKGNMDECIRIKEFLERRSQAYNSSVYTINRFYLESEEFLLVPRNFPIQKFIFNYTIDDRRDEGEPIEINHIIHPRSKTQEDAIKYLMTNENCILQLSPGVGKTVIAIHMIATRKRKTLILVHRESLADQWRQRLLDFTDLEDDKIARLKSTSFEEDLQKPIIICTNQTFISLLNRNRKNFLMGIRDANIGIFIADEVHTSVGAPTFAECSIHVPSKYVYGLSATPYRYDGNGDIIEFHLGKIFADDDTHGTMKANITVILCDYEIDTAKRSTYIRWAGKFQRARYLNMMKKSKPFMDLVKGLMNRLKNDKNILLMAERIKLIDELYDWLKFPSKSKFYSSAGLNELNAKFTFATPGKCRDGIDAPWKDTLIITSPISNIDQLSGRVVRTAPDKQTPSIIDMVDYGCSEISRTLYKRLEFYEYKEWNVNYLLFKDGKLSKIDKQTTFDILEGR
jgi:superfamily II DNA or RNA helicase